MRWSSVTRLLAPALLALAAMAGTATASAQGPCANASSPGARSYLPDCRAYEMVTPPYKGGYRATPAGLSQEGPDGVQVLVNSGGSFSDLQHISPLVQRYELARGAGGWEASPLEFPGFSAYTPEGISPDFQSALASTVVFAGPPPHQEDVFLQKFDLSLPGGAIAPLGPVEAPTARDVGLTPLGASANLHRVVFVIFSRNVNSEETSALWPGDTTADGRLPSLYEYTYTGAEADEPSLVGVKNQGTPSSVAAGELISDCGTTLGSSTALTGDAYNAISAGGSTVFFTAAACGGTPSVDELYARVGATPGVPAHTVAISEPTAQDCSECRPSTLADAEFRGASRDGSQVFFTTEQQLLPSAIGAGPYLYRYDFDAPAGGKVALLSTAGASGPRVQGVARVSEDGSHVYFVAAGALAGANSAGASPVEGADNLYVFDQGPAHPGGRTAFVATLAEGDGDDWSAQDDRPVQATPDGRFLVFQSVADLTPDEHGPQAGQVFEYDAQTESLLRISKGQDGYNENGNSSVYAASIPAQTYERESPAGIGGGEGLAVSADGSHVFFSSRSALTPQALNGITNVYEYHASQVGMISDGVDSTFSEARPAVELVGASESGRDVFFTTADRLLSQDTDNQIDVYDARAGGGFERQPAPTSCSDDACQGAPAVPPTPATPALPTSNVPGALTPVTQPPVKPKPLTNAQKRAKALSACRGKHDKHSRAVCEKRARKRYSSAKAKVRGRGK